MIICKSCGAPIQWAITPAGKRIPIDKEPVEDGNIILSSRQMGRIEVTIVPFKEQIETLKAQAKATGRPHLLFKSHFATCPNAAKHRKK